MTSHFVNQLEELRRRSLRMASQVEDMLREACEVVFEPDPHLAHRVVARDEDIDAEEVAVETEAIRLLALFQPMGSDLRLLTTILKVNNDLERIADCAVNIAERAQHLELQELAKQDELLKQMCPVVRRMLRNAIHAYSQDQGDVAKKVLKDDMDIDEAYSQLIKGMIANADEKTAKHLAAHLDVLSVAKNLERIADHATNVAEDVLFMTTGAIVRHRDISEAS